MDKRKSELYVNRMNAKEIHIVKNKYKLTPKEV